MPRKLGISIPTLTKVRIRFKQPTLTFVRVTFE